MKKLMIILAVLVLSLPTIAQAIDKQQVNLKIDCHTSSAYGTINVPEGKKATKFEAKYWKGQECGLKELAKALKDPGTSPEEAKRLNEKWDNRTPPPYGWGIKSTKGTRGYYYRVFHQHLVKSLTTGKLNSLWLAPGTYSVELKGYRDNSTLSLTYWLEPYTAKEEKKPAAATADASKAEQKFGPGIWGGVWYTHPGTITLTQTGNHVTGHYTMQNGKIEGTIVGNTLVGKWSDAPTYKPPMDAGDAIYKMAPDGMSFTVDFRGGYGENKNFPWFRNAWKATRKP